MAIPHPAPLSGASYSAVELAPSDDLVWMLDQRQLPHEERYVELRDAAGVAEGIRAMVVRGAPAIGIAAAYGLALEAHALAGAPADRFVAAMRAAGELLAGARPTAVNLRWAVEQVLGTVADLAARDDRARVIAEHARGIHRDDVAACRAMGAIGAKHLPDRGTVLTHCNAGALATGGYGTALGVIRAAREAGKEIRVLSCETRPYLQGARLTTWELERDGVPVELITDGMSAHFFARGEIDAVIVGADRVAKNGDVANKIGTYGHACLARLHDRPFYVAAPRSTLDPATPTGAAIVIEERSSDEVVRIGGALIAPHGVHARHPGFDVTPARLVTRLFTEIGEVPGERAFELMR
ncbi:MAG: S-methyl-5-thioribose-1-phosphate isomerase [Deltaproteobacteria bacterium]|nr:S-methyl-5-thioribose-1-phosphate isomerase [Deltaproteobacteria bacterium]